MEACNDLLENNELKAESEKKLVRYWLSNNITLKTANDQWFDESKFEIKV